MAKVIIDRGATLGIAVYDIVAPRTAATVAAEVGVTDVNKYDEVADSAFTANQFFFPGGFSVTAGTASWAIAGARTDCSGAARNAYKAESGDLILAGDFTPGELIAQAGLAAGSRDAGADTVIDNLNANLTAYTGKLTDIASAADADALKTIYDSFPT